MKTRTLLLAIVAAFTVLAAPASAACYADYKAKRENPLKLHYGVMQVDIAPCNMSEQVRAEVARRLSAQGWQLLQVGSVFDDSGLGRRKRDAGEYYLRY